MELKWHILYRGSLDSCNYDCGYCPFAKRRNTREQLDHDERRLERFVSWVGAQRGVRIGVLFTPWGEGLIHRHYQEAIIALSHLSHVYRVAIQTNLSAPLHWLERANRETIGLWSTYHPTQASRSRFLEQCHQLDALQVRYSVGVVGLREHLDAIAAMRAALPRSVYLWVNAYKDLPRYYDEMTKRRIEAIDPLFGINLHGHHSRGRECAAGETSFTVDGDGQMARCHFLHTPIGNIYRDDFAHALQPRTCPRARCDCHIGYVNLKHLGLAQRFGAGLLERIPEPPTPSSSEIASPATITQD